MDTNLSEQDVRDFCAQHEFLRVFVGKREGAPDQGEQVKGIEPYGKYLSLHHGRWRGVTVWDSDYDTCWLVAFSETHAKGSDKDAYKHFMSLGARDELLPTAEDYLALEVVVPEDFLDGLAAVSGDLYDHARANPGQEFNQTFGGGAALVVVDVIVLDEEGEMEQGWISIGFPKDTALNEHTVLDVISRILPPHIVSATLNLADYFGPTKRALRYGELVFTWDYVTA